LTTNRHEFTLPQKGTERLAAEDPSTGFDKLTTGVLKAGVEGAEIFWTGLTGFQNSK
jgi:hypothetical protein